MENKEILELLEKLNSLDINELDEEVAKMQVTYEQWSKMMGQKGYWSVGLAEILLEDKEALEGKRNIGFEDFKRLAKEYGMRRIELPRNSTEKKIAEQSQLLQEKLDPEKKIERYKIDIEYFMSCLEDETLDKAEYDEYQEKIKNCQASIKRCEEFQNVRNGKNMKNSEKEKIIEVAERTGEFFNKYEPQADGDTINYYIVGSLAQMLYASADKIEYCNIQDGRITELDNGIEVPEEAREKLLLTGRKIGDLDIIGINGYKFGKNYADMARNRMEIDGFDTLNKRNDKNVVNLMGDDAIRGELDNTVTTDRVCKLTSINGNTVYVASPETIIAQKLDKALKFYGTEFEEKKDTKDLVTFINGISQCYDEEDLSKRIADAWRENKSRIQVNKQNMQEIKKRLVEMKKEIKALDEMGDKDISLDNVFRIMAKSIIDYSRPQKQNVEKETENNESLDNTKIADIRKQMEWFYKGQTMLTVQDINEYCTEYGLDFNYEMGQARDRVELRTELDQADLTSSDKKSSLMMELSGKAETLGLDIETEIEESTQRNLLRKEMRSFAEGKSEMSIDEINNRCNSLGLNFNYEMENAKVLPIAADPKKCAKNIAINEKAKARDVRTGSSEIKNTYNELENPVKTTEDKSIDE